MKTFIAITIKFVLTLGAAWIAFSLFGTTLFSRVLIIALSGTILNYLIGDLFILTAFGNIVATIADGFLIALTAYLVLIYSYGSTTVTSFIIFVVIVAIVEYFFHIYLLKRKEISSIKTTLRHKPHLNYSSEIAHEIYPGNHKRDKRNTDGSSDEDLLE